jgi:RNA polymerase sigma-70 factor (ECF subfamily)
MCARAADDELIAACRRGDREAFGLLFETYQHRVYSIALGYFGGNEAAAKDATQQVFLKLFTRIDRFSGQAEFTTWLYRLVVNACIDSRRSGLGFKPPPPAKTSDWRRRPQEDACIRQEVAASVQNEVATLSPKLRLPVLLLHFEGLSYEEIARVLGCTTGTVASRLNRAHKALACRLAHLRGLAWEGS